MGAVRRGVLLGLAAVALSGCVTTKAVPIGGNAWRMAVDGRGVIGVDIATNDTLRDAAELTLRQGFTHFLLAASPEGPKNLGVRALLYGDTRIVAYGSGHLTRPLSTRPVSSEQVVRAALTVVMLRRGDPRIDRAYDALAVLARRG